MLKKTFEKYKAETDKRIANLEEMVDFLAKHGKHDIEFVYKNEGFTHTTCYARYIHDGKLVLSLVEKFPYTTVKIHHCVENNSDFAIIETAEAQYKLDKKLNRCVFQKNKKEAI